MEQDEQDRVDGVIRHGAPREEATEDLGRAKRLAAGHDAQNQGKGLDGATVAEMRSRMADGTLEQKFGEQARQTPEGQKAARQQANVAARARRVAQEQHAQPRRAAQGRPQTATARRVAEGQRNLVKAGQDRDRSQERGREQEVASR